MSLLDGQITLLASKKIDKNWFETLLKSGNDADGKAAAPWLATGRATVEKSLAGLNDAIHDYMQINAHERNSQDPDILDKAQKIQKNFAVLVSVLQLFESHTHWPASSHLHDKLRQEVAVLARMSGEIKIMKAGSTGPVSLDAEGKELHERTPSPGIQDYQKAHLLLLEFEQARKTAITRKVAYTEAKLAAKSAFTAYEEYMKKASPIYRAKVINWDEDGIWQKIENDQELMAGLDILMHHRNA